MIRIKIIIKVALKESLRISPTGPGFPLDQLLNHFKISIIRALNALCLNNFSHFSTRTLQIYARSFSYTRYTGANESLSDNRIFSRSKIADALDNTLI